MKNRILILMVLIAASLTSCLKYNLDDVPTYSNAEITDIAFEHRTTVTTDLATTLSVVALGRERTLDSTNATVEVELTIPAGTSSDLNISLSDVVGYLTISTAATCEAVGSAPVLGAMSDWSSMSAQYLITAADGTEKLWTVKIISFEDLRE